MVRRTTRKTRSRKSTTGSNRRTSARRKNAKGAESDKEVVAKNRGAHWSVYQDLQKKADRAWARLRADVRRKAPPQIILEDRDNLLLLLGECNYMARECVRISNRR